MDKARIQDLEVRHQLGRKEYKRQLESLNVVCDDIRDTRVELARAWVAEHYPDEDIVITASESTLENINMGFLLSHRYAICVVPTIQINNELTAYFDTIGGIKKLPD